MNDDSDKEMVIFTRALELPEHQRAAYLAEACAGDEALRLRIEALLRAHFGAQDFMQESPLPFGGGESVPERIGRYKLLQRIGEGGCGVVFLAEQEEPVRRQVALKLIKPGMDTESVIARFEAERQALAMMEHPNIAQVFDAGSTETGRPYFVMELVRGVKITEYCDQLLLSTAQRLELFVQVCRAVQHAHQKGIIHRDIKPSNILVATTEDGRPLPKVIDFGIAKATTGQRLTDKTFFTAFEMLVGTPAYMSPEQAALTNADVDTRTDIYSLGVLLYELLTGTTPFDTHELLKAGLDEVRRVIRNQEPARPSTRLSTMLTADLVTISQHRHSEPPKLVREVRGDLDWIVMKALEKDPGRRYPTATGLAEDVRHYLANEGVSARPPSKLYRFKKLAARNKLLFAAIAAILISLLAGLSTAIWSLDKERRARQAAEADKKRAEAAAVKSRRVTQFLESMISGAAPSIARGRDTTLLREIVDQTAKRIAVEFAEQPDIEADLCYTIGVVYEDLSAHEQAESMLRRTLELRRKLEAPDSDGIFLSTSKLANALLHQNKVEEAESLSRDAVQFWTSRGKGDGVEAASALEVLAMTRCKQQNFLEAEDLMKRVVAIRRQNLEGDDLGVLRALNNLGTVLLASRKWREAEQVLREEMALGQKRLGMEHPHIAFTLHNLGYVLMNQKRFEEAMQFVNRAVTVRRSLLGENHFEFVVSLSALADLHRLQGDFAQAEKLYRETVAIQRKLTKDPYSVLNSATERLALMLRSRRKLEESLAVLNEHLTPEFASRRDSVQSLLIRAEILARRGRWKDAAADAMKALEHDPTDHLSYHTLAPLLAAEGDLDGYRKLCGEMIARFGSSKDIYVADRMAKDSCILPMPEMDYQPVVRLAQIAVTDGKNAGALPYFQACAGMTEYRLGNFQNAVEWSQKAVASRFRYVQAEAGAILAMAQFQLQQTEDAGQSLARCAEIVDSMPALSGGDIGDDWRDWIISHALLDEARALIRAK